MNKYKLETLNFVPGRLSVEDTGKAISMINEQSSIDPRETDDDRYIDVSNYTLTQKEGDLINRFLEEIYYTQDAELRISGKVYKPIDLYTYHITTDMLNKQTIVAKALALELIQ